MTEIATGRGEARPICMKTGPADEPPQSHQPTVSACICKRPERGWVVPLNTADEEAARACANSVHVFERESAFNNRVVVGANVKFFAISGETG